MLLQARWPTLLLRALILLMPLQKSSSQNPFATEGLALISLSGVKSNQQTVFERPYSISVCPSNNPAPLSKYYQGMISQRRKKNASVYSSDSSFSKDNFNTSLSAISTHSVSVYSNNMSKSISNYRLSKLEKERERALMKEEQEMQSCTFRPSISGQSNYLADLNRSATQHNKSVFDSLYEAPKSTRAHTSKMFTFSPKVESKIELSDNIKEYLDQPLLQRLSQPIKETHVQAPQNKRANIPTKKIEIYKENKDVFNYLYSTPLQRPEEPECIKAKPYDMTNSNAILDSVRQKSLSLLFKFVSNNSGMTSLQLIRECGKIGKQVQKCLLSLLSKFNEGITESVFMDTIRKNRSVYY